MNYVWAGLFHPARKVRQPYWRIYNDAYVQSADAMVPAYPAFEAENTRITNWTYSFKYSFFFLLKCFFSAQNLFCSAQKLPQSWPLDATFEEENTRRHELDICVQIPFFFCSNVFCSAQNLPQGMANLPQGIEDHRRFPEIPEDIMNYHVQDDQDINNHYESPKRDLPPWRAASFQMGYLLWTR
jgi:diadenosine tetraphosphatase ApaH/serine/threonine PP2A family protein phosphatase